MLATARPRKRDRLKAVFRSHLDPSVSPVPDRETATQSNLQSSSMHKAFVPDPTASPDASIAQDDGNDVTETFRPLAHDTLWEDALSKLETSLSMEDRSHACALREFTKVKVNAIKQNGSAASDDDLIEKVKRAADLQHAEQERKLWEIVVGTRTIVLRDVALRIIGCLNKFKEIGDLTVQYDPVHAALPWAAFRFLLQVATLEREQSSQLLAGMDIVTQAYLRARIFQNLYFGLPDHPTVIDALKNSMIDLLSAICAFLGLAVKYFSSGSIANVARGLMSPTMLAQCISKVGETETQVEKNASSCEAILAVAARLRLGLQYDKLMSYLKDISIRFDGLQSGLANVEVGVRRITDSLCAEDVDRIFSWISAIPFQSDLYNARSGRLEGTCEWIIAHDTYVRWKASKTSTTLWLHGIPGAGKTKLATKVVDDIASEKKTHLAYFFCDRNSESHGNPLDVLLSITRQLSRGGEPNPIRECAEEAYRKKKRHSFASDKLTMEETRDLLLNLVNEVTKSTIIIDGLDECQEGSRKYILDTLDYLVEHSMSRTKIFVTSRNDKDLTRHYSSSPNLSIEAAHNQDDIEKLVMVRISGSQWATNEMSGHVRDEVVRLFRQKSQGMFQWASLHIDELLEFESNKAILDWLPGLPEGLKGGYDRIYDALGTKRRIYADRAFMWLMATTIPITPEVLSVLVCQDVSKEFDCDAKLSPSSLLSACQNLIKVDDSNGYSTDKGHRTYQVCKFAHSSVQEYLGKYRLDLTDARKMIPRISVKYWICVGRLSDEKQGHAAYKNKNSVHRDLAWFTTQVVRHFVETADLSKTNEDIWEMLLQTATGLDVVLGSPTWRLLNEFGRNVETSRDKRPYYASAQYEGQPEDELSTVTGPIGTCAAAGNQVPIECWLQNGLFSPTVNYKTARDLVSISYYNQQIKTCRLLLDAGTNFEGESSEWLEWRLKDLFQPNCEFEDDLYDTLIRLLRRLFEDGAPTKYCPNVGEVYNGAYPLQVARMFLERGADPNVFCDLKKTPLMHAIEQGDKNIGMTKLLLQSGAEVNLMNDYLKTALHYATAQSKSLETLSLLLGHGADPNLGDMAEYTPLQAASAELGVEAVKLLLGSNARINDVSFKYGSAIHAAALRGSQGKEIYNLLLTHGADPHVARSVTAWKYQPEYDVGAKYTAEQILRFRLTEEAALARQSS